MSALDVKQHFQTNFNLKNGWIHFCTSSHGDATVMLLCPHGGRRGPFVNIRDVFIGWLVWLLRHHFQ